MNFLNPFMLGGLAALSVPVAIHFFNRFRLKTTDWGAMRFLMESVRQQERRVKLLDLLLLALRLLVVCLAVFAFARPVHRAVAAPGSETKGAVAAMVLLDNSASMGRSLGAEICFDRAKRSINSWLDQLDPRSVGGLILVSNRSAALIPKPGPDFALFRKLLDETTLSDRGSDLVPALRMAVESLKNVTGIPREIRIYTDGQGAAWAKSGEILKLAKDHPEIRFIPILLADRPVENLAISGLHPETGTVAALQPTGFRVEVANHGSKPVENIRVQLFQDSNRPAGEGTLARLDPGATGSVSISATFTEPGPSSVTAVIPPDEFATDNRRSTGLDVVSQVNVLIAEETPDAEAMDRDGFYLVNALVPLASDLAARHFLIPSFVKSSGIAGELGGTGDAAVQTVFLCNPSAPTNADASALRDHVSKGGGLVIFPGERTSALEWKKSDALAALLPAALGEPTAEGDVAQALTWQSGGFNHPVTELWNDPAQGRLSSIKVFRHFPLAPKSGARVMAKLSDGSPAAVEWKLGEGTVVLFAMPATPGWSNLPLHPAFVPLTQRLMNHMSRDSGEGLALRPGEAFRRDVSPEFRGREFSVQRPESETFRAAGQVASEEGRNYLRYALTDNQGVYQVRSGRDPLATFAVQLDPTESDLRPVDPAVMSELQTIVPAATATEGRLVIAREYAPLLLWGVAVFFIMEAFLAHRLSHARA